MGGLEGHGGAEFLTDLAVVLSTAALSSVLFQKLRQPAVLGYLLAGVLIGPHVAQPLVARHETVQTLSELGVILLMFSLGLELSVRRLIQLGRRAGLVTLLDVSLMLWLGFLTARALGWSVPESLFAGAALSISSTMLVARTFGEEKVGRETRELAFGVLVFQDLLAILLVAILSAVAQGASLSAAGIAASVLRLVVFLLAFLVGGFLVVPRFLRMVAHGGQRETTLLAAVGTCFAAALLARAFGYSVALGAFVAGALAAESGEARLLERLVRPLRDIFAAIFFVSVGMMIDPDLLLRHATTILAFTAVVLCGKTLGVGLAACATGTPPATALATGMGLAQVGEFSFLIAGVGAGLGEAGGALFAVAVGVSVLTTFTTPWMVRLSGPLAGAVGRHAPRRLRHFAAFYPAWIARLGEELSARGERSGVRRTLWLAALDAALFCAVVIGWSTWKEPLGERCLRWLPLSAGEARWFVRALGALAAFPFLVGVLRCVRRIGLAFAREVLPEAEGGLDLAAAPRRALVVGLQLAGLVLIGLPVLAVTQPFLPSLPGVGVFVLLALLSAVYFWIGATRTEQKMRAGTEMIVELLARQSRSHRPAHEPWRELLRSSEELVSVPIASDAPSVGRSLGELDLRGRTGATVVCIQRGAQGVVFPDADEAIGAGDVLVVSGEAAEVEAARRMLEEGVGDLRRVA